MGAPVVSPVDELTPAKTIEGAARYLGALAAAMPATEVRLVQFSGRPAVAWCTAHRSGPKTWCSRCTIHVARSHGEGALLAALTPDVLRLLAEWLMEASLREANYQAGLEGTDDAPQPGEEAYDALRLAEALLATGPAGERGPAGPGDPPAVPDG
jgi:hypothetical protein